MRKMTFYNYASIEMSNASNESIADIQSMQWSTHMSADANLKDFAGSKYKNTWAERILPGGSVYSLSIDKNNMRQIVVTTIQAYLPTDSNGYKQVQATGGSSNLPADINILRQRHQKLVEQAHPRWMCLFLCLVSASLSSEYRGFPKDRHIIII